MAVCRRIRIKKLISILLFGIIVVSLKYQPSLFYLQNSNLDDGEFKVARKVIRQLGDVWRASHLHESLAGPALSVYNRTNAASTNDNSSHRIDATSKKTHKTSQNDPAEKVDGHDKKYEQYGTEEDAYDTIDVPINQSLITGVSSIVSEYGSSLLTLCQYRSAGLPTAGLSNYSGFDNYFSVVSCRTLCATNGESYAILFRGRCWCSYIPPTVTNEVVDLESCDAVCHVDDKTCNVRDKNFAVIMKSRFQDGNSDWTPWMPIKMLNMKSRYRGCSRDLKKSSTCQPEIERKPIMIGEITRFLNLSSYIGCFSSDSVMEAEEMIKAGAKFKSSKPISYLYCYQTCLKHKTLYAILSTHLPRQNKYRTCVCADTLVNSQPTGTCNAGFGSAVFWLRQPDTEPLTLHFGAEKPKSGKVLVVARYRSGSSMTQSFFVRNPESISLFEPCKMQAKYSVAPSNRLALKILEAFFSCDAHWISPFLHNSKFLGWSNRMLNLRGQGENYLRAVTECSGHRPTLNCLPLWVETCLNSRFIDVKTIKVLNTENVEEFTIRNPDVHVVHLLRDPRALLAAQKTFGIRKPFHDFCQDLISMGRLVRRLKERGLSNIHEVYYEQLASNASFYGEQIYREMKIEMPDEVRKFLSHDDFKDNIPRNASQVVVDDPQYHIFRFVERYPLDVILKIDESCQDVYKFWPQIYTDFHTLYGQHKELIMKYASKDNRRKLKTLREQGWS